MSTSARVVRGASIPSIRSDADLMPTIMKFISHPLILSSCIPWSMIPKTRNHSQNRNDDYAFKCTSTSTATSPCAAPTIVNKYNIKQALAPKHAQDLNSKYTQNCPLLTSLDGETDQSHVKYSSPPILQCALQRQRKNFPLPLILTT